MNEAAPTATPPAVRILPNAAAAVPLLLAEVAQTLQQQPAALLGLATGGTYAGFLPALDQLLRQQPAARLTHLDEYLGFRPDQPGGMVQELEQACPGLRTLRDHGRFLPVPSTAEPAAWRAHEARLAACGGLQLQFLGIGRNGHLAFNEPGTDWSLGFHRAELAPITRADAAARFAGSTIPSAAVTAGIATIRSAQRLVLCAFGSSKAAAVAAMLQGPVCVDCPASALQQHGNTLVLLDPAAASALR